MDGDIFGGDGRSRGLAWSGLFPDTATPARKKKKKRPALGWLRLDAVDAVPLLVDDDLALRLLRSCHVFSSSVEPLEVELASRKET